MPACENAPKRRRVSRTGPDMSQPINFMMKYCQESVCTRLETFIYDQE